MATNRCQGLPNGPCPTNRCDSRVKFGSYDLFLCVSCEKARDTWRQSLSSTTAIDCNSANGASATVTRSRRVGQCAAAAVTGPGSHTKAGKPTKDAIRAVLTAESVESCVLTTQITELRNELSVLSTTVLQQELIIKSLTGKLNFVLSYLELDDTVEKPMDDTNGIVQPHLTRHLLRTHHRRLPPLLPDPQ